MHFRPLYAACALLVIELGATSAMAEEPAGSATSAPVQPATLENPRIPMHPWGIEVEAVQPFVPTVNIFRMRGTRALWNADGGTAKGLRGDLLLGIYVRPGIKHDIVDFIHEYQIGVGYRQYVWRGLHAEVSVDGGVAWGTNLFDKQRYTTATLFLNTNVGYRFGFFEPGGFFEDTTSAVGLYAIVQGGVYSTLGIADIGPRNGKGDVFPQGNLLLGLSF